MTTPEERVKVLKAENQRLEQYLHTLSQEAWNHPSTCDQWTVADVIAHLTAANRNYATWITDALQADSVTPESLPRRSHERVDAPAAAQRVIAWRKERGNQLLSAFVKPTGRWSTHSIRLVHTTGRSCVTARLAPSPLVISLIPSSPMSAYTDGMSYIPLTHM
jgi:uncharacterized protein (TIGR03083 family)